MSETVLCGASCYSKKFYLNEQFSSLPQEIKDELKIMCVLYTEEVGGTFMLVYDDDGNLLLKTDHNEDDLLYDEIGSGLKLKQYRREKREFFEQLENLFKIGVESGIYKKE